MNFKTVALVVAALLVACVALPSHAAPSPGSTLPRFKAKTLADVEYVSTQLLGKPALVVVITHQNAAPAMKAWFEASMQRAPDEVDRLSIASLKLPFFISTGTVRSKARKQIPREFWDDVLVDKGELAKALRIPNEDLPVALAIGRDGRVLARCTGGPNSPEARQIWSALGPG